MLAHAFIFIVGVLAHAFDLDSLSNLEAAKAVLCGFALFAACNQIWPTESSVYLGIAFPVCVSLQLIYFSADLDLSRDCLSVCLTIEFNHLAASRMGRY